jgi:hypothetical protein
VRHATLELGQVISYLVYNLRQTINNFKSKNSTVTAQNRQLKPCTRERGWGGRLGACAGRHLGGDEVAAAALRREDDGPLGPFGGLGASRRRR